MNFNGSCPSLVENYAWVDERLREMYYGYALTSFNCSEYEAEGLLNENWSWVDDRLVQMSKINDVNILEPMTASLTIMDNSSVNTVQECLKEEETNSISEDVWFEEIERLVTINSDIFSDYSDDESILFDFSDSQ